MLLYRFQRGPLGQQQALTKLKSGSNLPQGDGRPWPWKFVKQLDISAGKEKIGARSADILACIEQDGYFLIPGKRTPPKKVA